jgi:multidrug efflux pump subunit AcrA (membrane-fusion protein)
MNRDLTVALRRRALPWVVWLALCAGAWAAYQEAGAGAVAKGFAEALPYRLSSVEPAQVESLLVAVGDRVEAGQVLAVLDGRGLEAERAALTADKARVLAEIAKAELEARAAWTGARQGLVNGAAETERAERESKTRLETAKAELNALNGELGRRKEAVAEGLMRATDLAELDIRQSALKRQVAEETAALAIYRTRSASADALDAPSLEDWVANAKAPLEKALAVHDSQIRALEARQSQRILKAPAHGRVVAVLGRPQSVVTPDVPLIELVAEDSDRIVVCLPDDLPAAVGVGTRVEALPRARTGDPIAGRSVAITPVIELPTRCWRDPRAPMWGRLVTVEPEATTKLTPGELFDIRFDPSDS